MNLFSPIQGRVAVVTSSLRIVSRHHPLLPGAAADTWGGQHRRYRLTQLGPDTAHLDAVRLGAAQGPGSDDEGSLVPGEGTFVGSELHTGRVHVGRCLRTVGSTGQSHWDTGKADRQPADEQIAPHTGRSARQERWAGKGTGTLHHRSHVSPC